ncbi:MAG TPA: hypothetical protein PKN91_10710, partial [Steroidobacteraceae bacterium]|nr:hypothetical protein [Steroidobacteraceae bacterium]
MRICVDLDGVIAALRRPGETYAGDAPVQWMNMSIGRSDMPALGRAEDPTGSVDLGDDRVGASLSRVP